MRDDRQRGRAEIRVAVAGSYGFMDIGDEAMLTEDLAYLIGDVGVPRELIYLFGALPEYVSYYHEHPPRNCLSSEHLVQAGSPGQKKPWVKRTRRRVQAALGLRKKASNTEMIRSVLQGCDVALITGGGTVNTRGGRRWSLERVHALVLQFRRHGLPVFMSGQTIGPLGASDEDDRLARETVEAVDVLTVRDDTYSRRYLDLIGANPKELIETFDDAYSLPYADTSLPADVEAFLQSSRVGAFNVTEYTAETPEQRVFVAELIERVLEKDLLERVVCVAHTPHDLQNLWMIRDMVQNGLKARVYVPDTRRWRAQSLKLLISRCAVAVGGRYHFIVFAGTSNTPFVGMCGNHYSYVKQDGFARPLGLSDFILTEKETWNRRVVDARIEAALDTKLSLAERFQRPSVSMSRLGTWLRKDLGLLP